MNFSAPKIALSSCRKLSLQLSPSLPHTPNQKNQQTLSFSRSVVRDLSRSLVLQHTPLQRHFIVFFKLSQSQVRYFIEEVIGEPVDIAGNSLGGFVALYFAACNPLLVKDVTLLNATPFWGFSPNPVRSPRLAKISHQQDHFLYLTVWQKISDPQSIAEVLKQVYADHSTNVDNVFSRILETSDHPAAAASLASIMLAPQGKLSFKEALARCQMNNIPICLMYGKEDPWVKPIWGLQVKRQVPQAPYYEISPAGHCPHDEVLEVVNYFLSGWIKNLETQGSVALPLLDAPEGMPNNLAKDLEFLRDGSKISKRAVLRIQVLTLGHDKFLYQISLLGC